VAGTVGHGGREAAQRLAKPAGLPNGVFVAVKDKESCSRPASGRHSRQKIIEPARIVRLTADERGVPAIVHEAKA
jgi:hypothetical protein